MPTKKPHILFFLLLTQIILAQISNEKRLVGKITVADVAVEKVNIQNATTGKATVSNELGIFSIPVKVIVNENPNITAENLGIIPHGQKKYSPAERRVREATTGSGLVPLNPILNAISGRTTMLKKEVQVEKKERLLLQLDGLFQEKFYVHTLKIPTDYIKGFHYFLIEDTDFVRALKAKNKTLTQFLIKGLAIKYKETLSVEEK